MNYSLSLLYNIEIAERKTSYSNHRVLQGAQSAFMSNSTTTKKKRFSKSSSKVETKRIAKKKYLKIGEKIRGNILRDRKQRSRWGFIAIAKWKSPWKWTFNIVGVIWSPLMWFDEVHQLRNSTNGVPTMIIVIYARNGLERGQWVHPTITLKKNGQRMLYSIKPK